MTTKAQIAQQVRERLYAALRAGDEIVFVETFELAAVLDVPMPDEETNDTAQLGDAQRIAYLLIDQDTQPSVAVGDE